MTKNQGLSNDRNPKVGQNKLDNRKRIDVSQYFTLETVLIVDQWGSAPTKRISRVKVAQNRPHPPSDLPPLPAALPLSLWIFNVSKFPKIVNSILGNRGMGNG